MTDKEDKTISSQGATGFVTPSYAVRNVVYYAISENEIKTASGLDAETNFFYSVASSSFTLMIAIILDCIFTGLKNLGAVPTLVLYYFTPLLFLIALFSFIRGKCCKKRKNDHFSVIKKESKI
jgi:hypothetical protein